MSTRIQAQTPGRNFRSFGILCGLGLLIVSNLAATPEPPVLFIAGDNTDRIEAILGKYTRPSNLDGLQYPVDPVTTQTFEVRTNAELTAAVSGDGRLIRIYGPGNGGQATYNQFSLLNRSDIDIVMDNDATISGPAGWDWRTAPVRRVRWTGGNIVFTSAGAGLTISDVEDLLLDDLRIYKTDGTGNDPISNILLFHNGGSPSYVQRVAIINSTIEFPSDVTQAYCIYTGPSASNPNGNWVIAGNRLLGGRSAFRLMHLGQNAAVVGNYLFGRDQRVHFEAFDVWIEDNVAVNRPGDNQPSFNLQAGDGSTAPQERFRIFNNRFYATQSDFSGGSVYRFGDPFAANNLNYPGWEIRNNTWHDPTGPTTPGTWGSILIENPYIRENDRRIGPGHADYELPPSSTDYGANR